MKLQAIDCYEVLDPAFARVRGDIGLEQLYDDCRWAEGPVYLPAGRYLVWSDIPNDRLLRWDETTNQVGVFRAPAGYSNGNAVDHEGRLLTCEHGNRRITRTEHDGCVRVLVDRVDGLRLNSPNDLCLAPDGAVWFTDASYGIDSDYEGNRADSEIGECCLYRLDVARSACVKVAGGFQRPTGITFSPQYDRLYVADSRANHVKAFDLLGDTVAGVRVLYENSTGNLDSMAVDEEGRIWIAAGDGVHCLAPDGTLLGKIRTPEMASNVEFGGPKRNRMFITASTSLYSLMLGTRGARRVVDGCSR